jgi:hypothetical protein
VFDGKIVYSNSESVAFNHDVDKPFVARVQAMLRKVCQTDPLRKVPSAPECKFCSISSADCPERLDGEDEPQTCGGDLAF